jgi:hypothetical protein
MDDQDFRVRGIYRGINIIHGEGELNTRIIVEDAPGHFADGLVPNDVANGYEIGATYDFNLTNGNPTMPSHREPRAD